MRKSSDVFALKSYTVRKTGKLFFVSPTANGGQRRSGPYASLQRATIAIARKLQREFTRRSKRSAL